MALATSKGLIYKGDQAGSLFALDWYLAVCAQPREALKETFPGRCATRLYRPLAHSAGNLVQLQLLLYLCRCHATLHILLVGKDEQQGFLHLAVGYDTLEFLASLVYTQAICTVNDEYQALGAGVVMSPERPNLVLTTHIPDIEFDILISDRFDIEAHSRYRRYGLIEFELIEYSCTVSVMFD